MIEIIFIGSIIFIIWLWFNIFISVKLPLQTLNFYMGGLGSGKTTKLVDTARKLWKQSKLKVRFIKPLIPNIKLFKRYRDKIVIREVYSNFPLRLSKKGKTIYKDELGNERIVKGIWAHRLTISHLLWKEKMPDYCIVVVDEVSLFAPKKASVSDPRLVFCITLFRHACDPIMLFASQSVSDCNIDVRRKINLVYSFSNFRKVLFKFYKVDVDKLFYNEDVQNINNIKMKDKNIKEAVHFGCFGTLAFDSRYFSLFYDLYDNDLDLIVNNWDFYSSNILGNESHWHEFKIQPNEEYFKKYLENKKQEKRLKQNEK